ncbi:GGDEF domain-containing protein [Desulfocurvus sp. DL9XJH121]
MLYSSELFQVLYECLVAIGGSVDLPVMLRAALATVLRKFNCTAGAVLLLPSGRGGRSEIATVFSIPRNVDRVEDYREARALLRKGLDEEGLEGVRARLPLCGEIGDGRQYMIMDLPDVGFAILLKSDCCLTRHVVQALRPVFVKLASSCKACQQYQELERHREDLEDMVWQKSRELVLRNEELALEVEVRKRTELALEKLNLELERLASVDGLTQVANRRLFDQRLEDEWRRLVRQGEPLSLIMCDVDYFKNYNDTYGHIAGDDCLRRVARAVASTARRPADLAARYGGEEFVVLLPGTNLDGAAILANDIQAAVAALDIPHSASMAGARVTLSIGVSSTVPVNFGNPEQLVSDADKALYEAKNEGRNRVVLQDA